MEDVIVSKPEVSGLSYISKDSASKVFQQEFGMGSEAIASLDFLPASFRVVIADEVSVIQVDSLVQEFRSYEGVDEVRFNLALLETIEERTDMLMIAGVSIGIFILLVAIVLVFNTIRLTIYAKRDLIRAMKLVGATNSFIRRPFLVEGILQGIIAGSFAAIVITIGFEWLIPIYIPQIDELSWPYGEWYYLVGSLIILSILMGLWGSRLAARKFIRDTKVHS